MSDMVNILWYMALPLTQIRGRLEKHSIAQEI